MNLKTKSQVLDIFLVSSVVSFVMTLAISFIFSFILASTATASPSLMLFPTRVVFEKNKRAFQVDLTNTGVSPGTYRITLENKRMTEDGQFVSIDVPLPGELSAEKIIQYSPRQVVLAPGAGQTVRIVLRKPADLPVGEYRSHLVFRRLPDASVTGTGVTSPRGNEVGVTITPLIGASIPIIIQNGATAATVKLANLKYIKPTPNEGGFVEFRLIREGNRSAYGDLTVIYVPKSEPEKEIANVKGIAVYSPYPSRMAKVTIQNEGQSALGAGKLKIRYTESKSAGGKLISESSIDLP